MALAGDQEHIATAQIRYRAADRLATIADFECAGRGFEDRRADCRGIFAAGIIVGDDDPVRELGGDCSHHGPLASVAVAATTEYDDQPAARVGPQRLECLGKAVRLVGIIDEDRRTAALADEFEPTLGTLELGERREGLGRLPAGCNDEPRRKKSVIDLERAR